MTFEEKLKEEQQRQKEIELEFRKKEMDRSAELAIFNAQKDKKYIVYFEFNCKAPFIVDESGKKAIEELITILDGVDCEKPKFKEIE